MGYDMLHPCLIDRLANKPSAAQIAVAGHAIFDDMYFDPTHGNHFIVIPVVGLDKPVINAIRYAKHLEGSVSAVHILLDYCDRDKIEEQWERYKIDVPLFILESPDRSILEPLTEYIDRILRSNKESHVTVVLPVIITVKWWQRFLFNQTARLIEKAFQDKACVTTIRVPFSLPGIGE